MELNKATAWLSGMRNGIREFFIADNPEDAYCTIL
jgi:hypothetical protein